MPTTEERVEVVPRVSTPVVVFAFDDNRLRDPECSELFTPNENRLLGWTWQLEFATSYLYVSGAVGLWITFYRCVTS